MMRIEQLVTRCISEGQYGVEGQKNPSLTHRVTSFRILTLSNWMLILFYISPAFAQDIAITRLTNDGHLKQRPIFSPDGRYLVYAKHVAANIQLFLRDMTSSQISEQRLTKGDSPEYDAVFSPDGKLVAYSFDKTSPNQGDIDIHVLDFESRESKPLFVSEGGLSHEEWPSWSPDGMRIAFTSTQDGNQELYVADADGQNIKRLTSDPAIDAHPAWSPDGKEIVFSTNRWGDLELATIDPEGANLRRLTDSPGLDDYPAWSPDGHWLAFTSNRTGDLEIFIMQRDGTALRNVTNNEGVDNFPAFHPDGRLVFVSDRSGGFEVYVTRERVVDE